MVILKVVCQNQNLTVWYPLSFNQFATHKPFIPPWQRHRSIVLLLSRNTLVSIGYCQPTYNLLVDQAPVV